MALPPMRISGYIPIWHYVGAYQHDFDKLRADAWQHQGLSIDSDGNEFFLLMLQENAGVLEGNGFGKRVNVYSSSHGFKEGIINDYNFNYGSGSNLLRAGARIRCTGDDDLYVSTRWNTSSPVYMSVFDRQGIRLYTWGVDDPTNATYYTDPNTVDMEPIWSSGVLPKPYGYCVLDNGMALINYTIAYTGHTYSNGFVIFEKDGKYDSHFEVDIDTVTYTTITGDTQPQTWAMDCDDTYLYYIAHSPDHLVKIEISSGSVINAVAVDSVIGGGVFDVPYSGHNLRVFGDYIYIKSASDSYIHIYDKSLAFIETLDFTDDATSIQNEFYVSDGKIYVIRSAKGIFVYDDTTELLGIVG